MERLIRIVCFWSVVAALIAGCNRLAEECLDVAEACMETNPDSAYSSLQCLALREDLTGEQRARYALLRTQAFVGSEQAFEGVEDHQYKAFHYHNLYR